MVAVCLCCVCSVPVTQLMVVPGSGSVTSSTVGLSNVFIGQPSPDKLFVMNIPIVATQLTLTLCSPVTNYNTYLWLIRKCPTANWVASDILGYDQWSRGRSSWNTTT